MACCCHRAGIQVGRATLMLSRDWSRSSLRLSGSVSVSVLSLTRQCCEPCMATSTRSPSRSLSWVPLPCVPSIPACSLIHSVSADSAECCMGAIAADKLQAASVSFASTRIISASTATSCGSVPSACQVHSLCPDCIVDNLGRYMYAVSF